MYNYEVSYKVYGKAEDSVSVIARNKEEAYTTAFYEAIPEKEGELPYSAWVASVTYKSGKVKQFNTSEGNAY